MRKVYLNLRNKSFFLLLLIFISTFFLGIGYAQVTGVDLSVSGTASARVSYTLLITNIRYLSNNGADLNNSTINSFFNTTMDSTVTLGNSLDSTITYEVTVYNNSSNSKVFNNVVYSSSFYDNNDIVFELANLTNGDTIAPNNSKTFTITFKYNNNLSSITNNVLNSYLNFDFDNYYTITYSHITNNGYPSYIMESETTKTITFTGDIPYDISINPVTNFTYNSPVLTISNVTNNITIDRYYSITYYLDGGTNPTNQETKYLYGQTITILSPTKTGKTFGGWYDNSSFSGNPITSTAGYNQNLTLYAKWDNASVVATTYISNIISGLTADSNGIYTATSSSSTCTNTLAYDGTTDNNLRYVGASPCNYIRFNNEDWRIIGVMKDADASGTLKIIKANLSTSTSAWNTSNNTTWVGSTLQTRILSEISSTTLSTYALSATWPAGKLTQNDSSGAVSVYATEQQTKTGQSYVGLFSITDHMFATSGGTRTRPTCLGYAINKTGETECYNNNWTYTGSYNWTIIPNSQGQNRVFEIANSGQANRQTVTTTSRYYRPVVYLKPLVKITGGNGSSTNPYTITID